MRATTLAKRYWRRPSDEAVAPVIGTSLMVAITVAGMSVVGLWAVYMVTVPEEPPEVEVSYSHVNDRWSIPVTRVDRELPLGDFRLVARHADGSHIQYDSDIDGAWDTSIVGELKGFSVASGDGPQDSPLVFIDVDGDGNLGAGDTFMAYAPYFAPVTAVLDADRGYRLVGLGVDEVPLESTLAIIASPSTLGSSDIYPGDEVKVELSQSGTVYATQSGYVGAGGALVVRERLDGAWPTGNWKVDYTIRPGEGDEWVTSVDFKVAASAAITPAQRAAYDVLVNPLDEGDTVTLVHESTNTVVLEFGL
jgi:flagellin-like protein